MPHPKAQGGASGLCIQPNLKPYALIVSGSSGCNKWIEKDGAGADAKADAEQGEEKQSEHKPVKYLLLPLIVLSGVAVPLGAGLLFLTGWLGRGQVSQAASAPWWVWTGGLLGVFIVIVSLSGPPNLARG